MNPIKNDVSFANGITQELNSPMQSLLSSYSGEVNDAEYSQGHFAICSPLALPVISSYITLLPVDIPLSAQSSSSSAMTLDFGGGFLMPLPGYSVLKTEDPYSSYDYPTQNNESSVCVIETDDTLLNESSANNSLNKQAVKRQNSKARRRLSFSSSAENASVKSDTVWRPW